MNELIGYIMDENMNTKAAPRKANMTYNSAKYIYMYYSNYVRDLKIATMQWPLYNIQQNIKSDNCNQ
jgi:hypothetical protein